MKKKITFTLLAALTLLVTYPQITKAANIVKTVNVDQTIYFSTSGYFNATDTLSFQEIAEALGTDTASIDKTVSLTDGTSFLYAKDIDGNLTNKSTANTPGFWFDKNGVVSTWANGFFASEVHADAIENKLYIVNSGKPNTPIGSYTATEYIVMGDNQVQINVTLNIVEKPAVNWGGIQFVKSFDVTIDEYPDNKYATKEQVLKLSDVAAALGTTPETMETLSGTGIVYAKDTLGYSDSYTGGGINQFWLSKNGKVAEWGTWTYFKNADTGEADSTRYSAFFSQFYFNSKGDSLEIVMGQYPDVLVAGDVCTSEQYIVMGNKAVTINLKLNIVEKPVVTWDEMKDVGDYTIEQDKYYNDGYTATAIHLDMDDMAKKFGIDKSTLVAEGKLYAIDAGGGQSDKYTANGMGFWFDQNGMICTWGTSSRFAIEYHGDQAVMNLAFMPSVVNLNDEFAADLYLAHNASYVKIALKVKAIDKVKVTKPDVVATYPFEVQIVPSADSYNTSADFKSNQSVTLDLTEAAKAMGEDASTITSKLDLFGVSNAAGDITDVYNCDPNPAFWLKDTVTNWPNAPYGIIYANSGSTATFSFVQMPGLPKTGDVYTSKLYLVNRDKNEAVECRFTISFVDNMFTYQEVGSKDLSIALKPTDADTHKIAISLSDMATGFGIPSADLKAAGGSYPFTLYAMTETGAKTSTMTSEYGFWMTKDGNVCSQDNEACSFGLEYYGLSKAAEQDFDNIYVTVWGEVVDGDILTGKLYIGLPAVDGVVKLFTYNVVIYISNDPDGISTAKLGSKTDGNVYDLSGRLVRSKADSSQKLAKGIYILNNKKIAVK